MTREMGKVLPEARGDVQEAIDVAYYMAGEGRRLFGQTVPSEMPDKFAMAIRRPIGVVGIITPWNFPVAIPAWKLFPALICGNTAVIKPASDTPACLVRFVELLLEGGLPEGVVNVVTGSGAEVGNAIVDHPDVRVISFTGHTDTGVEISTPRGEDAQARQPRAGRQEPDRDLGGRGPRSRARLGRLVGVRHVRPAMHRGVAADRPSVHPRRLRPSAPAARGEARPRRRARRDDRCRAGHQRDGGRAHRVVRGHRPQRGRSRHRRPARARGCARQGLVLRADDLRRGQARRADRAGGDLRPGHLGHPGRRPGTRRCGSSTA